MATLEMSTIGRLQANESFLVSEGITGQQVVRLIELSATDPDVRRFTSDPKRFKDKEAFDEWKRQGKVIYTLVDEQGNLYGIIWFGEKDFPVGEFKKEFDPKGYTITFAIRIYGDARGKGLAKPFTREAFDHFLLSDGYRKMGAGGIWLETSIDNKPALRVYERFGFKKVTNTDEEGKIVMILSKGVLSEL